MIYTITLPATHYCNSCRQLIRDPRTEYEQRGRYYYVHEACRSCGSRKLERVELFTRKKIR